MAVEFLDRERRWLAGQTFLLVAWHIWKSICKQCKGCWREVHLLLQGSLDYWRHCCAFLYGSERQVVQNQGVCELRWELSDVGILQSECWWLLFRWKERRESGYLWLEMGVLFLRQLNDGSSVRGRACEVGGCCVGVKLVDACGGCQLWNSKWLWSCGEEAGRDYADFFPLGHFTDMFSVLSTFYGNFCY